MHSREPTDTVSAMSNGAAADAFSSRGIAAKDRTPVCVVDRKRQRALACHCDILGSAVVSAETCSAARGVIAQAYLPSMLPPRAPRVIIPRRSSISGAEKQNLTIEPCLDHRELATRSHHRLSAYRPEFTRSPVAVNDPGPQLIATASSSSVAAQLAPPEQQSSTRTQRRSTDKFALHRDGRFGSAQ